MKWEMYISQIQIIRRFTALMVLMIQVEKYFDSEEIIYPNGITISDDNKYLYVASTNNGIRVLDLKNQKSW